MDGMASTCGIHQKGHYNAGRGRTMSCAITVGMMWDSVPPLVIAAFPIPSGNKFALAIMGMKQAWVAHVATPNAARGTENITCAISVWKQTGYNPILSTALRTTTSA